MNRLPADVDVVVIGAGAAGLGVAQRLADEPVSFMVLEARDRPGGRGHSILSPGGVLDLGCGWLHSADRNPLAQLAEQHGFHIDRSPPPWMRQAFDLNFPIEDQQAYREAFEAFETRLEAAAHDADRPAAELLEPGGRWNAMLDAFSGYYNGAPFAEVSVHDYAAYEDSGVNWRVREGYGTAIAALADHAPVAYGARADRLDHSGSRLRVDAVGGVVIAHVAIVCLPSTVIAEGRFAFDPPLPEKRAAADALPLGHVEKAFLALAEPEAFPVDSHLYGRLDTALSPSFHLRPLNHPVVECFFGGALAESLEAEPPGAFAANAIETLVELLGSDIRRQLSPLAETSWTQDPLSRGAYSHARPGCAHLCKALAESVEDRIFFAGEACSAHAFSTAHGAYETGVAAAEDALRALRSVGLARP
ncbi:MAG: NAD(P)/FAD-dependent oxidoreductase [Caulobacteraceae bacterium]